VELHQGMNRVVGDLPAPPAEPPRAMSGLAFRLQFRLAPLLQDARRRRVRAWRGRATLEAGWLRHPARGAGAVRSGPGGGGAAVGRAEQRAMLLHASWLNRVECRFRAPDECDRAHSDFRSHETVPEAIALTQPASTQPASAAERRETHR